MKTFSYKARASDGSLKSGNLVAADRGDALRQLKAMGVVPLEVAEQSHSIRRKNKWPDSILNVWAQRVFIILLAVAVLLVGGTYILTARKKGEPLSVSPEKEAPVAQPLPKKETPVVQPVETVPTQKQERVPPSAKNETPPQRVAPVVTPAHVAVKPTPGASPQTKEAVPIRGAQRRLAEAIKKGERISPIFTHSSESILSLYTKPGLGVVPHPLPDDFEADMQKALKEDIVITDSDSPEEAQEKELVAWLKEDVRQYIAKGGTATDYVAKLAAEQSEQADIYAEARRILSELMKKGNADEAMSAYNALNEELESRGIVPLPLPRRLRVQAQ